MIIPFKRFFQRLTGQQLQWDELLPEALLTDWKALVEEIQGSQVVSIPRTYHHGVREGLGSLSLCGFCDASTTAYAAVVYLVARTETGVQSQFVACKTRVAPLQTLTIPRLELLSALLLARLSTAVSSALESTFRGLKFETRLLPCTGLGEPARNGSHSYRTGSMRFARRYLLTGGATAQESQTLLTSLRGG